MFAGSCSCGPALFIWVSLYCICVWNSKWASFFSVLLHTAWGSKSGPVFTFSEVGPGESGQYYCEARNRIGAHSSPVLTVKVRGTLDSYIHIFFFIFHTFRRTSCLCWSSEVEILASSRLAPEEWSLTLVIVINWNLFFVYDYFFPCITCCMLFFLLFFSKEMKCRW